MSGPPSVDKPDRTNELLISTVVLTVLGAAFVGARLYVRFVRSKSHGWDDYFIIGALASSIVSMALTIAMCENGYGKSVAKLEPSDRIQASKFSNFALLINGFSMAFLKVSIGLSLLRLQLGRSMTWIIWASIVLSVLCNAIVMVGALFACRPIEAIWNKTLENFTCIDRRVNVANSYVQTGGNIVTDLFYTLGPIFYLQKVKVSVYNKWALRGVFLVGLLATACAVAKCFELPKLRNTTDPTYDGVHLTIWVRAELNAGLIAASIPPLKSLFEEVLRRVFHIKSGLHPSSGTPAYGAYGGGGGVGGGSGSRAYGMHSFKQAHQRHRTLTDEDDDDVGRNNGHATYIVGGKKGAAGRDADSEQEGWEEDQKHILQARSRERNGSGSLDLDEEHHGGGGGDGRGDAWIVKTVDYTVSESMSIKGQAR